MNANACSTGSGYMTLTYDDASNLETICDGQGTVTYTYDAGNRLKTLAPPSASCPSGCVTYDYDTTGTPTNQRTGRLTTTTYPTSPAVTTTYEYFAGGALKKIDTKRGTTRLKGFEYTIATGGDDTGLRQTAKDLVANLTAVSTTTPATGSSTRKSRASIRERRPTTPQATAPASPSV